MLVRSVAAVGLFALAGASPVVAQSLSGSRTTMRKQNSVAQHAEYTFLATSSDVKRFVDKGLLVLVRANGDFRMSGVSYPYARPAVKLFVERLAVQYRETCGEKLVVTSLTRPLSRQPWNASELSVHPAGMATDLRVPKRTSCRRWLEGTLKSLEARGVIDATKERRPAHYHIAIYPNPYTQYVAKLTGSTGPALAASGAANGITVAKAQTRAPKQGVGKVQPSAPRIAQRTEGVSYASILPMRSATAEKASGATRYTVKHGDTLWSIAHRYDLTIVELKKANGLWRSTLQPGQTLMIPGSSRATANSPDQ